MEGVLMLVMPEWLAPEFRGAFLSAVQCDQESGNTLNYSGLLKPETKPVWEHLKKDMENAAFNVPGVITANIAGAVVGAFVVPLSFGYGEAGTSNRPSWKTELRGQQRKADKIKANAAIKAGQLVELLTELKELTPYLPDTVLDYDLRALRKLINGLTDHPDTETLFSDVPGMKSNKSSWKDWKQEAEDNLRGCNRMYAGGFELSESEWETLTLSLFGKSRREPYLTKKPPH